MFHVPICALNTSCSRLRCHLSPSSGTPESSVTLFLPCEETTRNWHSAAQKRILPGPQPCWHCDLRVPRLQNCGSQVMARVTVSKWQMGSCILGSQNLQPGGGVNGHHFL
ncbi:myelodysplastic syndrome 2 translocation-associated protein-like [Symphalangus syndactylus]|uniref:myelodysplastic syndrome 2 translocation-associated protein-like n=1 Tax=Symphalangus syndactylus TaxID=9590 RepID=UPI003005BEAD